MGIDTLTIKATAPTRIDLGGGTLDIWPLYLLLKNPLTVNLAIDLSAQAMLTVSSGSGKISLKSNDQVASLELDWDKIESVLEGQSVIPPALILPLKLLRHFCTEKLRHQEVRSFDVRLTTTAKSPAGAGLGGSSSLNIAICGALNKWVEPASSTLPESLIAIARDVETTVIRVPAGLQDYYAATYGGLQSLRWGVAANQRMCLSQDKIKGLEERLLLFYSGQSRNSGINNWALFKAFMDGNQLVRSLFEHICDATSRLEGALLSGNWRDVALAIDQEWQVRRKLAPGISTPEIDRALLISRSEAGAVGKVCGAGGGGCFFVVMPDADCDRQKRLMTSLEGQDIKRLPVAFAPKGLEVKVMMA